MSTKITTTNFAKLGVAFLLFLLAGIPALAQSTANYTFATAATGSLALDLNGNAVDLTTGATTLVAASADDTEVALTSIGFDFWYMGTQYTQFSASDNGILSLGALSGTTTYALPNGTKASLAPFANDLRTGTNGVVRSKVVGTAPNRCLVIEWSNTMIRYISTAAAGTATFQARLYESTGAIEYMYGAMTTNTAAPAVYYVGFSNNTTVNKVVTVNTTAHTASTSATVTSNSYTASSTITSLNSASNGSRRFYKFTQTAPTAPTGLNFTAVTANSMSLNWTDASSNEMGFVIYSSTDNTTFTFDQQVAANTTTASVTGLTPNALYYYKVYAVREGALSSALTGSKLTQSQVILTAGSGSWTPPNCVTSVSVEVWGAGGGGGSSNNTTSRGGSGGGGGAYAKGTHTVAFGNVYYYSVGAVGTGGPANSTTAPTAGGQTWFNAVASTNAAPGTNTAGTLAVGGGAGVNNSNTTPTNGGLASASLGNVTRTSGANGAAGTNNGGGNGGTGANGGAGGAGSTSGDGADGTTPAGGGGGSNDSAAAKGGDGAIGQIIITYSSSATQQSAAPVVSALCAVATSVSGTSSEANSTIIEVFKNGVSVGTTTVTSNAWTKTGLTLAGGDVITATAASVSPCKSTSALSSAVTVSGTPTTSTNGGNKSACVNTTSAALGGNTPTVGTGLWTCTAAPVGGSTGSITFTSASTGNTTAIVAPGATAGNYTLTWTISNSPCTASSSTMTLAVSGTTTTATNTSTQTICPASTAVLSGNTPTVGTGAWSVLSGPSTSPSQFSSVSNPTAVFTPAGGTGAYVLQWTISSSPCTASSASATVTVGGAVSTWNGSAWDVTPSSTSAVVFAGNYTAASNLTFCSVTVTSGTVTIPSGYNITLNGAITVSGGSFVLENNANLVQNTNSSNSGNIIVNRNSAAILRQDYTLWSSPVTNTSAYLQAFSPQTLATRFYTYNPSTNVYVAVSSPSTTPFAVGTGYLIRVANNHNAVTPTVWAGQFTGVPNNGPVSLTVGSGTYNAIGNPYPSTISADSFISANSLTEALYFWRKTNNLAQATSPTTSYATYTTAGGAGTGPSSLGGIVPNGTIQVGQGFIAKSTSTSLNFTNSMRTTNNSNQFLRTGERSRVWLDLYNAAGSVSQALVAYMPGATLGIDAAIDGHYINDAPTALTSIIDNEEFSVQGRPLPLEATDVVPLGFKSQAAGTFTIALNNVDGLFASNAQTVYLKDNLTNTIQDLTAGNYDFATEAGTFNSRFEIVYENLLATQNPTFTENSVVVYKNDQQVVVNAGKTTIAKVQVYDISGRLLVTKTNVNATEVRFTAGMANQVVLVKVTSASGAVVTKKIVN